jgi:hypothetical protein
MSIFMGRIWLSMEIGRQAADLTKSFHAQFLSENGEVKNEK